MPKIEDDQKNYLTESQFTLLATQLIERSKQLDSKGIDFLTILLSEPFKSELEMIRSLIVKKLLQNSHDLEQYEFMKEVIQQSSLNNSVNPLAVNPLVGNLDIRQNNPQIQNSTLRLDKPNIKKQINDILLTEQLQKIISELQFLTAFFNKKVAHSFYNLYSYYIQKYPDDPNQILNTFDVQDSNEKNTSQESKKALQRKNAQVLRKKENCIHVMLSVLLTDISSQVYLIQEELSNSAMYNLISPQVLGLKHIQNKIKIIANNITPKTSIKYDNLFNLLNIESPRKAEIIKTRLIKQKIVMENDNKTLSQLSAQTSRSRSQACYTMTILLLNSICQELNAIDLQIRNTLSLSFYLSSKPSSPLLFAHSQPQLEPDTSLNLESKLMMQEDEPVNETSLTSFNQPPKQSTSLLFTHSKSQLSPDFYLNLESALIAQEEEPNPKRTRQTGSFSSQ